MSGSEGWLAPVSYLPGVQPPSGDLPTPAGVDGAEEDDDSRARPIDAAERKSANRGSGRRADRPASERSAAPARRAENVSLAALTRRGLSRRELERTLRQRQLDDDTIAAELARLESVGLVDDVALAQQLVGRLQERKGLGRTAIAAELSRRMLSPAAIEYGLDLIDSGDELAVVRELAARRARQLGGLDRDTAVRRLTGYLLRRGYSGSTLRAAVDSALPTTGTTNGSVRFR
ncbi:MAG: regulatory protein RecX [Micrococcales bacterium]|nr:regulatory protein RecX [Micrococcales bacterium]